MIYGDRTLYRSESRTRISLDGEWRCVVDAQNSGAVEGWGNASHPIWKTGFSQKVPSCLQANHALCDAYPSDCAQNSYLGNFWMKRSFFLRKREEKRYYLTLGGVVPCAHIFVNGKYIFTDECGLVSASEDVTEAVQDGENTVIVSVVEQNTKLLGGMRYHMQWSGLYRTVYLEERSPACLWHIVKEMQEDCRNVRVYGDTSAVGEKLTVSLDGITAETSADENGSFSVLLPITDEMLWSPGHPHLTELSVRLYQNGTVSDDISYTTGIRLLRISGSQFLLNGKPLFLAGTGSEYLSPMICPLTDRAVIRARWQAVREDGFVFYRFHTSIPTEEELAEAEKVGLLLSDEVSIISNFSKTEPFDKGLELLKRHIRQTADYGSMAVYCLGNEGSQLMIHSQVECNRARVGYRTVKEQTAEQLVIIAFGLQGELPELPNDFESPHLWGKNFAAAYDGLTQIPWETLSYFGEKPAVIHEFGKFGVWPDPAEETAVPKDGFIKPFGTQAKETLARLGLSSCEEQIIRNSRQLAALCWKNILEGARRNSWNRGYVTWTYFRGMHHNSGFADDFAVRHDVPSAWYRDAVNAPIAVLTDRNFGGRTLRAGSCAKIGAYVSDFGGEDIPDADLWYTLRSGDSIISEGTLSGISVQSGETRKVGVMKLVLPYEEHPVSAVLTLELRRDNKVIAGNAWDYWIFVDDAYADGESIVLSFTDAETEQTIKRYLPCAQSIDEADAAARGCRTWLGSRYSEMLDHFKPSLLITDHYDDCIRYLLDAGIPVLFVDTGNYPKEWYHPLLMKGAKPETDPSCSYSAFRSGWDCGNLGTIIVTHPILGDFPTEQFCDLQYYAMLQGRRSLNGEAVEKSLSDFGSEVVIRGFAKIPVATQPKPIVQDPQALKDSVNVYLRFFDAREQQYLTVYQGKKTNRKAAVTTLALLRDPAGEHLFRNCIDYLKVTSENS